MKPMKKGARLAPGAARLSGSVRAKMTNTRTAVPKASTSVAVRGETSAWAAASVPNRAGLGKYWPKTIAARSLPGCPRTRPSWASKRSRKGQKAAATVAPARTAPASCAPQ